MEHCPAPFLGLTVQRCGEPCGSAAGFDFLSAEVIQLVFSTLESMPVVCGMFLRGRFSF